MKSLIKAVVKLNFFVDCLYVENITTKDSSVSFMNVNGKKTTDDAGYWCLNKRDILQDPQKVA